MSRLEFEFDVGKSHLNKIKHGIDFVEAQAIWSDESLCEVVTRSKRERRFIVTGRIGEKLWSAIVTYRSRRIRIISVRRARNEETNLYRRRRT